MVIDPDPPFSKISGGLGVKESQEVQIPESEELLYILVEDELFDFSIEEELTDEEDSFGVSAEEEFITGFFEEEECGSIVEEEKIEEEISKEEEDNVESTAEGLSLPHEEKKKRIKRNTM